MDDITISMWACVGICATAALFLWYMLYITGDYCKQVMKTHKKLSEEHFAFYDRLYKLRETTLKEMLDSWKDHYNKFITHTYIDFLDQAYAGKFGEKQGWVFKLPPDIGDFVDLEIYYTSDEIKDIYKARDLYGEDKRLESLDKRLGL
jgi:regulator of sigma D